MKKLKIPLYGGYLIIEVGNLKDLSEKYEGYPYRKGNFIRYYYSDGMIVDMMPMNEKEWNTLNDSEDGNLLVGSVCSLESVRERLGT